MVASNGIAASESDAAMKLGSINNQSSLKLLSKEQLAYSSLSDAFLLINNDSSVVSPLVAKDKKPKGQSFLNKYGEYVELPGYSYGPNSKVLHFISVRYLGLITSENNSKWSLFELQCKEDGKSYGFALQLTSQTVNIAWLEQEQLNKSKTTQTMTTSSL